MEVGHDLYAYALIDKSLADEVVRCSSKNSRISSSATLGAEPHATEVLWFSPSGALHQHPVAQAGAA